MTHELEPKGAAPTCVYLELNFTLEETKSCLQNKTHLIYKLELDILT